ncbi:MAG: malonic semialdehyde reductase [Candidatus Xenobia bacterium]
METVVRDPIDLMFRTARTFSNWLPRPVPDELLRQAYDLARLGPTSANTHPMRLVFVKSAEGKAWLKPCLLELNVEKTMAAPVTAIVADDQRFYEFIPKLFPQAPHYKDYFAAPENAEAARTHAFRNSTLGAAYFILALRAVGLDCGPMSGFNNAAVDKQFFPDGRLKSNFLINIGYGDNAKLHPRNPRLEFEEACSFV